MNEYKVTFTVGDQEIIWMIFAKDEFDAIDNARKELERYLSEKLTKPRVEKINEQN